MQPGDVMQTYADISKSKRLLKYDPQTSFEKGIEVFVRWFKEKLTPNKLESAKFQNSKAFFVRSEKTGGDFNRYVVGQ